MSVPPAKLKKAGGGVAGGVISQVVMVSMLAGMSGPTIMGSDFPEFAASVVLNPLVDGVVVNGGWTKGPKLARNISAKASRAIRSTFGRISGSAAKTAVQSASKGVGRTASLAAKTSRLAGFMKGAATVGYTAVGIAFDIADVSGYLNPKFIPSMVYEVANEVGNHQEGAIHADFDWSANPELRTKIMRLVQAKALYYSLAAPLSDIADDDWDEENDIILESGAPTFEDMLQIEKELQIAMIGGGVALLLVVFAFT